MESDQKDGVYLSYFFKVNGAYSVGDTVTVSVANEEASFRVAGFYHNPDTGTISCTDIAFLITKGCPNPFLENSLRSYRISIVLSDHEKADIMESVITGKISAMLPLMLLKGSSHAGKILSSRYITSTVFTAIIGLGALLMTAVVLIVIAITLSNYIRNNTRSLGALKALGYTSKDLISPVILLFTFIALFMSLFGSLISYALLPTLNSVLEKQTGIPYKLHFIPLATFLSVGINISLMSVTAFLSVIRIRFITPIHAIRMTKAKKKNAKHFFGLEKTRFGLNTAISLQKWIGSKASNLVLFLALVCVSILIGFTCFSYQNILSDPESIIEAVCGQTADSLLGVVTSDEEELRETLRTCPEIDSYYLYTTVPLTPKGGSKIYTYIYDNAKDLDEEHLCIEGHLPASDREIAVNGTFAKRYKLKVGDELLIEKFDEEIPFVISGLAQGAFHGGLDAYMTREGYERISVLLTVSYNIDLKDGTDIDAFNDKVDDICDLLVCTNYRKSIDTLFNSYLQALTVSVLFVIILSVIIIAFVLYILITISLANRMREHGILKSLGFLTRDIIYQTTVSILPTAFLATIVGLWIARSGIGKLLTLVLNFVGIFSLGPPIQFRYLLIAGVLLFGVTLLGSVLLSARVRKIAPHMLFNNE